MSGYNPLAIGGGGYKGLTPLLNPNAEYIYISPLFGIAADTEYVNDHTSVFTGKPDIMKLELVCITSDVGYTAGDVIDLTGQSYQETAGTAQDSGLTIYWDESADAINVIVGQAVRVLGVSTKNWSAITLSSWKLRVIATKTVIGDVPDITLVGFVPLETFSVADGTAQHDIVLANYWNDYDYFLLEYDRWQGATDSVNPAIRFSADGTTFATTTYFTNYSGVLGSTASQGQSGPNSSGVIIQITGTGAAEHQSGSILLKNPQEDIERYCYVLSHGTNASPAIYNYTMTISRSSTTQIVHTLRLMMSSGNIKSLNGTLYGMRKVA